MALSPGARFGPYEIVSPLGAGGMGEVYRTRDTRLDRTVALKVLPSELAADAAARARFEREARAIAALDHPHICSIFDVGEADGTLYLVMPLLDGQTLAARLAKGPLSLDQALKVGAEIADALDKAHRQGIVHRDLKPANVMLTKAGAKLLDFGLAKLKAPVAPISLSGMTRQPALDSETQQGTILGTVPYMAPEQVEGREADARSDIWALGAVLYEMVTGVRPFGGDTPASVIGAILKDTPAPISTRQPLAPHALDRLVSVCLAKDPDDRWQAAGDVGRQLAWITPNDKTDPVGVKPKRRMLALIAVAAALVAGTWLGWASARATRTGPEIERRSVRFQIQAPPGAQFVNSTVSGGSAIAPDGRSVAFVAVTGGLQRLWVQAFDSLTARELQDTDGARLPFWSPDSRSVGFFANGDLKRIDVQGGASVVLSRAPEPRGGAWNANGTIVFSPSAAGPLFHVSAVGGTATPLTTLMADDLNHRWPQFLPDGRSLLYFVQAPRNHVNLTSLDRPSEARTLLDAPSHAVFATAGDDTGYLLRVVRGTIVAQRFDPPSAQLSGAPLAIPDISGAGAYAATGRSSVSVSGDGSLLYSAGSPRYQLAWFNPDGTAQGTIGAVEEYFGVRLSPDDHDALVTISAAESGDLWRVDLTSGARSRLTTEGRGWFAVFSPDGERIAFTSQGQSGLVEVMGARGGAGRPRTLLEGRGADGRYPSDWSDEYLVYAQSDAVSAYDVWVLPMAQAGDPRAILNAQHSEYHAQLSPNGRWIAFTSNESGPDNVYVQDFPALKTKRPVSSGGGSYPRWSRDGGRLLYRGADGRLMSLPLRFAASSVEPGPASAIMRLVEPPALFPYPYDVAADGRILALTRPTESAESLVLTVVTNLQTALRP